MSLYKKRKSNNIKGNKTASEVFYEAAEQLFELLVQHPHFIETIKQLRKRYRVNVGGIENKSDLLLWESKRRKTRDRIHSEQKLEVLVKDFDIAPQLTDATVQFTYYYLLTNQIDSPQRDAGFNIIQVTENDRVRELNPYHTYLEVTPYTTLREIKDHWKRITNGRSEIRGYGVPSTTAREQTVWELHQKGLGTKAITDTLNAKYPSSSYSYDEILKLKSNYKNALSKLKPLE